MARHRANGPSPTSRWEADMAKSKARDCSNGCGVVGQYREGLCGACWIALTRKRRFWSKVDVRGPDECWPWTAGRDKRGYGKFCGSVASRCAWEFSHQRRMRRDRIACHRCGNPSCCNPAHIYAGTDAQNARDRERHGRTASGARNGRHTRPETSPVGTRHGSAKLTDEQVRDIRRIYRGGGISQDEISYRFGVSQSVISGIVRLKGWRHVA